MSEKRKKARVKTYPRKTLQYRRKAMPEIYNHFLDKYPDMNIPYNVFADGLRMANKIYLDAIIEEGADLPMSNGLGTLSIRRVERNHNKKMPDWQATYALECNKDKIVKMVYFTDDHYFRFYWRKKNCRVRNKQVYQFKAVTGAMKKFVKFVKSDELNPSIYKDAPKWLRKSIPHAAPKR